MMQPLLLLKQTLEAPYDPGPLLLNGPNAKFTSVSQFWPSHSRPKQVESLRHHYRRVRRKITDRSRSFVGTKSRND